MPLNFIIIPIVIIVTAVIGNKYTKQGLAEDGWFKQLQKPSWTPRGNLMNSIWLFIYVTTGLAVLWYWNVPLFSWVHYVAGAILLYNAYLKATWNKVFFVDHNIQKAYRRMILINVTSIAATVIMFIASPIGSFLMLPYIIWIGIVTYMTKQITQMNK